MDGIVNTTGMCNFSCTTADNIHIFGSACPSDNDLYSRLHTNSCGWSVISVFRFYRQSGRCHTCTADLAVKSLFVILYYNIKSSIFGILFLLN